MKKELERRFHELNPSIMRHERFLRISLIVVGLSILIMMVLAVTQKEFPSTEMESSVIWCACAATGFVMFFGGMVSFMLFDHLTDKAYELAISLWDKTDNPSNEQLARLSVSHEFTLAHRKAAAKVLDNRDPHWRQKALAQSCAQLVPSPISLPKMGINEKDGKYTLLFAPLVFIGVGLVLTGLFKSSEGLLQNWTWLVSGVAIIIAFLYLAERFIDGPARALQSQWEDDIAQSFSIEKLIEFEAANSKILDGKLIRSWLDKHNPGWSLSPARPLWAVACACDESD